MEKVSGSEKFAYSMGAFGQNFAYGIMMTYLMNFYTDSVGIAPGIVATLFLVTRIWDAANDPLTGFIIDRAHLKSGKYRPFILVGGVLIGVATVLCFINPGFSMTGKIVYAFVTYIIWSSVYSFMDIPYWSMAPSMTDDPNERTRIVSLPKITATIGSLITYVVTIPLVSMLGGGNESNGFFFTALIFGAICAGGAILAAVKTKERIKIVPKPNEKFRDSINLIAKNRPLIIVLLVSLTSGIAVTIKQTIGAYYFEYIVGDKNQVSIFVLVGLIPMVAAMVLAPVLSKKFGKKNTAIAAGVVGFVFSAIIYYFQGLPIYIFNALSMVGIGVLMVMSLSMISDTVEYGEWKTGKRSESIVFSLFTFSALLSGALGGAIPGYWLDLSGYVAGAAQNASSLDAMSMMLSWAPAIMLLVMTVILLFYNLSEKRYKEILGELESKRLAA